MGGETAESAYDELEQSLQSPTRWTAGGASSSQGDVLTVLLLLWSPQCSAVLPRALASPLVFPLLSSLVLRCNLYRKGVSTDLLAVGEGSASSAYRCANSIELVLRALLAAPSAISSDFSPGAVLLPESLSVDALVVQLVLHGRIAAAAEFVWRAHARPITLYSPRSGLLFLQAELEGKACATLDKDVGELKFRDALQMLNNSMQ